MSPEKSKKSAKNSGEETELLETVASSLKEEIHRGLSLLDQCVNNVAQAKWILIHVETAVDKIQTKCSNCDTPVQVVKDVSKPDSTSMNNTKLQPTSTKSAASASSSKNTNVDGGKQKMMPVASLPPVQRPQKEKSDLNEKTEKSTHKPTAKRTGGPPGKSPAKPKKLLPIDKILKKAKLTQVSLQCVAAIMKGRNMVDIKDIPKRDPKFKIDTSLFEEKKEPSSNKADNSSKLSHTLATHDKPLKKSGQSRDRESEVKTKAIKSDKYNKIRPDAEKSNNVGSHKSRRDSTESINLPKRRHSSSSSSKSGSCSTCSSSTVETFPRVSADKPHAAKKPKIIVASDEEMGHKAQPKIKVSRDTFSVLKSKAAVKYHEEEKQKSKSFGDHNGKGEKEKGDKAKAKISEAKTKHESRPHNSKVISEGKSKMKKSENSEKPSKGKSSDSSKAKSVQDSTFEKLKTNLEPDSRKKDSKDKTQQPNTTKPPASEPKANDTTPQIEPSGSCESAKTKPVESAQVDSEMEAKIQGFLSQLKSSSGGKTELKYIKQKNPLITQAMRRGITSLDSPELRAMLLEMFERHKAEKLKQDEVATKAAQQPEKETADQRDKGFPVSNNQEESGQGASQRRSSVENAVRKSAPSSRLSVDSRGAVDVDSENGIPDEDTDLYNEARRLGIKSTKSEEYNKLVADQYATFKNKKAEEMKALKNEAQKVFSTGTTDSNPEPAASCVSTSDTEENTQKIFIRSDILEPVGDDESIELGEDVIGNCLNFITSTATSNSENAAGVGPPTVPTVADHASKNNSEEHRGPSEAAPAHMLTLQDTVSPTAMEKFFSNDSSG